MTITGNIGYEAFNPRYLFNPEALAANAAANLVAPLINKKAIQADYMTANAKQLQAVYNYQRTVLNAFTEVVNRVSKVENYSRSLEVKRQQLNSLEKSVDAAKDLFNNARVEYVDVLLAQRDFMDARMVVIETKNEQLAAIVNAYQALGGGGASMPMIPAPVRPYQRTLDALHRLWHFGAHEQSHALTPTVLERPAEQNNVLPVLPLLP
jgi:outer membrane protein TolC